MPSAELSARVTFMERVTVEEEGGVTRGDWFERFTVAASIPPRLGGETVIAARLAGTQPLTITVRQSAQTRMIRPDWKAVNARTGVEYNIRSIVDPNEHDPDHGKWIDLLAEAGATI